MYVFRMHVDIVARTIIYPNHVNSLVKNSISHLTQPLSSSLLHLSFPCTFPRIHPPLSKKYLV